MIWHANVVKFAHNFDDRKVVLQVKLVSLFLAN